MLVRGVIWVVVCAAMMHCACDVARADGREGGSPAAVNSPGYSQDQVDGIIGASVDELWVKTDYYWHRGDYPRIIALDRLIVEADPTFMEPYSVGGWLMESDGDLAGAEAFYRLGVANNQDSSYMYYNLGVFYFNTVKKYAEAVNTLQQGAKKKDADINDWRMLAHAYEKNHQLNEALDTWKTIKHKWPDGSAVDHNLARVERLIETTNTNHAPQGSLPGAVPSAPDKATHPTGASPVISL